MSSADPDLWSRHDAERARLLADNDWPAWCYAPVAAAAPVVDHRMQLATLLSALAAWRTTKGIYRFDATLMAELSRTPLDEGMAADVLQHLPDQCVYVELRDLATQKGPASGVWAWIDWDGRHPALGLVFDLAQGMDFAEPYHHYISLSQESVLASLQANFAASPTMREMVANEVTPVLSLLLYMCSSTAEISHAGIALERKPHGPAEAAGLAEAPSHLVWNIGTRLGDRLRSTRFQASPQVRPAGRDTAPRLRAARWHTGPSEKGAREVRWIPPAPVRKRSPVVRD